MIVDKQHGSKKLVEYTSSKTQQNPKFSEQDGKNL